MMLDTADASYQFSHCLEVLILLLHLPSYVQMCCDRRSSLDSRRVEEVIADGKASKVVVKGKTTDPIKVCERLQKKSSKNMELISPLPVPLKEKKEEEEEIKEP
ncbi:hypothetical protein Fmac_011282 [Flemingia macrophylla]|uniref:Uncharacterized protein n=1 Tax=Flemingia macrophylla TaxID=520843 RepID=A0ABD1MM17_9FABA